MTRLSSKQILQENQTDDHNAISALSLNHKALSHISCLADFKNLERLDLSFNNLTSLQDLKLCVNLKWLSVLQNKLQSLEGIEELSKLTVSVIFHCSSAVKLNGQDKSKARLLLVLIHLECPLPLSSYLYCNTLLYIAGGSHFANFENQVLNAGKNKLRSMDEVRSLVSLRALILNDNEIGSICRLDRMKDLNTLEGRWILDVVLVANEGIDSMLKSNSSGVIFLSRNPVHEIGESLVKLKSITKLSLSKCQIQSIGSSLKSCIELKELRLAHNDIKTLPAELAYNTKLQNLDLGNNLITSWSDLKVIRSLVNLKNFNLQGNPIAVKEKLAKKTKRLLPNLQIFNARPTDKITKYEKGDKVDDFPLNVATELEVKKKDKRDHGRAEKNKHNSMTESGLVHLVNGDLDVEKELKKKKRKANDEAKKKVPILKEDHTMVERELNKKARKVERGGLGAIDDGETPFMELFAAETAENSKYSVEDRTDKAFQDSNSAGGSVSLGAKKKKTKRRGISPSIQLLSLPVEVGLGGPSTWDDE
ncbi:hypothetical protein CK203_039828 [Vitis vinifera]|uniref:Protein phosphatase 1 regulatory subunit 7 n=1 Tax=Vitis vinifera TaxID=29760 RepID=A0A438HQN1_VITVI|nr:hypothetical protein CK203_039828 [Vitis vinifera]